MLAHKNTPIAKIKEPCFFAHKHHKQDHIVTWQSQGELTPQQYSSCYYDFHNPDQINLSTSDTVPSFNPTDNIYQYQHFQFPGYKHSASMAQNIQLQTALANINAQQYQGKSNIISLKPAISFRLAEHPDKLQCAWYYILKIHHKGHDRTYLDDHNTKAAHTPEHENHAQFYQNAFTCSLASNNIASCVPYEKPHINGVHSAKVVGPKGQSIYTDEFGRVKVQFQWDKDGQSNENTI